MTRRREVLRALRPAPGEWRETHELANGFTGGNEGTRRLRELRAEGYRIEVRRNPDPTRPSWQYRLIDEKPADPDRPTLWEDVDP